MSIVRSVSTKGQVTLPAEVRRVLKLRPRDRVAFSIHDGEVRVTAARSPVMDSYQAVPPLRKDIDPDEAIRIATEEHAVHVAGEGR